jgi:glycosyltransferase involved in cell wall biosynthesis
VLCLKALIIRTNYKSGLMTGEVRTASKHDSKVFLDKSILVVPEGPIGFDGIKYRNSKGELSYLERLASQYRKVILVAYAFRPGHPDYEGVAHSVFQSKNLSVKELCLAKPGASVVARLLQLSGVFRTLWVEGREADVMYLFTPSYPSALAWIVARLRGKPHFVYAADDWEAAASGMFKWSESERPFLFRMFVILNTYFERAIAKTAVFCVTAGPKLRGKFERFCPIVEETIPRMTLTLDDARLREDTPRGEVIQLLNVGGLVHDKAQHQLLEMMADLEIKRPGRFRLTIVGEGQRRDELGKMSRSLGVDHVVDFMGYVRDERRLYDLYEASDIFVLSSVSEGFPRVFYECMAMHLPIVSTRVGSVPNKMSHNVDAVLVDQNDPVGLSLAVQAVTDNDSLRQELISSGYRLFRDVFGSLDSSQIPRLMVRSGVV